MGTRRQVHTLLKEGKRCWQYLVGAALWRPPKKLTDFKTYRIYSFDVSAGNRLMISRRQETGNLVLEIARLPPLNTYPNRWTFILDACPVLRRHRFQCQGSSPCIG